MTVLLGRTSAAGTSDFNSAGQTSVWPFVAVASGELAVIKARSETVNTASAIRLGVYADDAVNARAGALLAVASVDDLAVANGTGTYQATLAATVAIVLGTKYWLGRSQATDNHNFVGVAGTGYLEKAGDFPDPYGSGGVSTAVDGIIWGEDVVVPVVDADYRAFPKPPIRSVAQA